MTDQAPTNPGQAPAEPPAAPPALPSWTEGFDEVSLGYVKNKGWQSPADVLTAYRGAEKFISAPVDRRLVLPSDSQDTAAWNEVYAKLGRPSEANGYELKIPDELGDKAFAEKAASWFHSRGLSKAQGQGIVEDWNAHVSELMAADKANKEAAFLEQDKALRTEWGGAFDARMEVARNAARSLGVSEDQINGLAHLIGHKAAVELFHKFGEKMGEGEFVTGQPSKMTGVMTPGEAKAKLEELKSNKDWSDRYFRGEVSARQEMQKLMAAAYPEVK